MLLSIAFVSWAKLWLLGTLAQAAPFALLGNASSVVQMSSKESLVRRDAVFPGSPNLVKRILWLELETPVDHTKVFEWDVSYKVSTYNGVNVFYSVDGQVDNDDGAHTFGVFDYSWSEITATSIVGYISAEASCKTKHGVLVDLKYHWTEHFRLDGANIRESRDKNITLLVDDNPYHQRWEYDFAVLP